MGIVQRLQVAADSLQGTHSGLVWLDDVRQAVGMSREQFSDSLRIGRLLGLIKLVNLEFRQTTPLATIRQNAYTIDGFEFHQLRKGK